MAGGDLRILALVSAVVTVAMCYVRFAARRLRPGLPRLAVTFPVLTILPFPPPLAFRAVHLRVISGFFLAWLAEFKLLLLTNSQGPLHPSLPLPTFVAVASGPIRLRADKSAQTSPSGLGLVSSGAMATGLAVIVLQIVNSNAERDICRRAAVNHVLSGINEADTVGHAVGIARNRKAGKPIPDRSRVVFPRY